MREAIVAATLMLSVAACGGTPRPEVTPSGARPPAADAVGAKPAPRFPRLDGALNAVLASEHPLETAAERGLRVQEERIRVSVTTAAEQVEALSAWLVEQGARRVSSAGGEVQADVSVGLLRELGGRPEVSSVRRPSAIRDPGLHDPLQ